MEERPQKLLYIIGAGASCKNNNLPLAKTLYVKGSGGGKAMAQQGLAYAMKTFPFEGLQSTHSNLCDDLKQRFSELEKKAEEFGDVDTYAKYLHIMDGSGEHLRNLKETLVAFFVLKQRVQKSLDSRYLPWLVGIMEKRQFPENVKVMSWNYDFQMELAVSSFIKLDKLKLREGAIEYHTSFFKYDPSLNPNKEDFNAETLSLVHLNGVAAYFNENQHRMSLFCEDLTKSELLNNLQRYMNEHRLHNHIRFAWESRADGRALVNQYKPMIQDSTILVVVGYSFPFYNREVDRAIFDILIGSGKLEKIYFQDPFLDGQQLRSQFGLRDDLNIVHIKNVDNFHIPFEY